MLRRLVLIILAVYFLSACYHGHPVTALRGADQVKTRTLFIGLDGIDYALVREIKDEGGFKEFNDVIPLVSTFPSATTIGFTGIFQPLGVGAVPGYEVRFYDYEQNKIIGGTPKDIYKIPIAYKYYFDAFRHTMQEKGVMYAFPSMASVQDLDRTETVVLENPKRVVMTYLGGTDGSAHVLGRIRTKRTLKYMDRFLTRLKQKYRTAKNENLRIVLFSDHGFDYTPLKNVSNTEIKTKLRAQGFHETTHIQNENDIVLTRFGLLTAGVGFAPKKHRAAMAKTLSTVRGLDLVFWHNDTRDRVHVLDSLGHEAYFDFKSPARPGNLIYRYVPVTGDPLGYAAFAHAWRGEDAWLKLTYDHHYPDAGYRLYDAFFNLVKNNAGLMFSLKPDYQFGALAPRVATWGRIGQRGTHGGLFKNPSLAFVMTNDPIDGKAPKYLRYDQMFTRYLPTVVRRELDQRRKVRQEGAGEDTVFLQNDFETESHEAFEIQLAKLEKMLLE